MTFSGEPMWEGVSALNWLREHCNVNVKEEDTLEELKEDVRMRS
jgi:hypothetical protein